MIETQELNGLWWRPDDDTRKLSGTLKIVDGRGTLDVLGSFGHDVLSETETERVLSLSAAIPRLHGLTTAGKEVTLEGCFPGPSSMNFPGIPTTSYRARVILLGGWYGSEEQIEFDEFAIRTTELDAWAGVSGFTQTFAMEDLPDGEGVKLTRIDLAFEPPAEVPIALDDGAQARVVFNCSHTGITPVTTEATITQTALFFLRYGSPRGLDGVLASALSIRNFLSLAVGRPLTVLSVTGFKDDFVRESGSGRQPVGLIWEIPHNPDPPNRPRLPDEMLFTLGGDQVNISDTLRAWFAREDLLEPVLNLYFGMLYHPDIYLDVRFLSFAQAVETYDYRRREATDLPPDEHERRMTAVLEASPPEHHDWLRMRLAGSNLLTLRRRVRDVLAECRAVSDKLVGPTKEERRRFLDRFIDSRNYYTHYSPELESRAAKGEALYLLVVQLRALIEMSLLRELGFPCTSIDETLAQVGRYSEIAHFKEMVKDVDQAREPPGESP